MATGDSSEGSRALSPTSERENLILELSNGLPGSRSWLDSLALSAIRALSRENVSQIFKPVATPVVSVPAPASSVAPAVVAPPAVAVAQQLPPEVVAKLIVLSDQTNRVPKHFISPPKTFGTKKLTEDEITRLGSFRKDTRFSSTLEAHLQWLNQIAEECPHASEKSFIDSIHVCLPLPCLKDLEFLKRKTNSSLSDIYNYMQTHYGTALSRAEVFKSLSDLTSSVGEVDPLTVLQKISMLLLQVTEDSEDCERAALRDSLSYLKILLRTEMFLNLTMFLGNGDFGDLYRICKCDYKDILLSRYQEKRANSGKVRQVNKDSLPDSPDPPIATVPPPSIEDVVRQILGRNNQPLSCFSCGSNSHLLRECPSRQGQQNQASSPPRPVPQRSSSDKKSSSSRLPYAEQQCAVHQNSSHRNSACFKQQQIPCRIHNGSHSQAACKKVDQGKPKSQNYPPPQPLFPNSVQQLPHPQVMQHQYPPMGYQQPWMNSAPAYYSPQQYQIPQQPQVSPPVGIQPRVPQPGTARHLALQQGNSSSASSVDPTEFDEETKAKLLRALSEALSE